MSEPIQVSMPIAAVEMQEFLFAETLARVADQCEKEKHNVTDWASLRRQVREAFRLQRFAVMNWLLMNGVSIPAALLSDTTHATVGNQLPDKR